MARKAPRSAGGLRRHEAPRKGASASPDAAKSLDQIKDSLREKAEDVGRHYLGEPTSRTRRELRWGRKGSRRLDIRPTGGGYFDFERGEGGSLIDLIAHALDLDFPSAVEEARAFLGDAPTSRSPRVEVRDHDDDERRRIAQAQDICAAGRPIAGTPAETYLASRGIGRMPVARYVPARTVARISGWHWWRWSAVAFPVTDSKGTVRAVQLVALEKDGGPVHWEHGGKIKISRGSLRDGAVRLPGPGEDPLVLAEGPETAASCWNATGWETWAALGSVGRADLSAVPRERLVVVAADDDPLRAPSRKTLRSAIKAWRREGRRVVVATPWKLSRRDKSDFNDRHQAEGLEAVRERLQAALPRLNDDGGDSILEVRKALYRAVGKTIEELLAWRGEDGETAPFKAIGVTTGVGKTAAAIAEIVTLAKRGGKAVYLVPTHRLGAELRGRIEEEARKQGTEIRVRVRRGREAENPEEKGETMCADLDTVREAQKVRADVSGTVCMICPFRETCPYLAQDEETADIWIAAHENLFHETPAPLRGADLLVIDEGFATKGLLGLNGRGILVSLDQLENFPAIKADAAAADLWTELGPIRAKLSQALRGHPDGALEREHLVAAGLAVEEARQARGMELKALAQVKVTKNTTRQGLREEIRRARHNVQIGRLALLWAAVEKLLAGRAERSGLASIDDIPAEGATYRAVRLYGRQEIRASWLAMPTIHIDAMLDPVLLKARVPHAEIVAEIEARQHARVLQIPDKTFGKAALSYEEGTLDKVWAWSLAHARQRGDDWLVVMPKAAEDTILERHAVPPFIRLAHYGALAGRDEYRDVAGVICVGRPQPAPADVERVAGILSGEAVHPVDGWYPSETGTLAARDGAVATVEADRHPDELAEAVRRSICEAELLQAIGRGRAVNRSGDPLEIVLLGNIAVPGVPPDRIGAWSPPDMETEAFARTGVWLTSAGDMAAVSGVGREALKRARTRSIQMGTRTYKSFLYMPVPICREVRYRRKAARFGWQTALYDPRTVPDIETFLRLGLGDVVIEEVETVEELIEVRDPVAEYAGGIMPQEVAAVLESRLRAAGVSQGAFARQSRISQPQLSNACAQRFGLSEDAARRLKAALASLSMRQPDLLAPA